jgi:hypothetical protein
VRAVSQVGEVTQQRPGLVMRVAERAPDAELFRSRGDHYDVYEGGEDFDRVVNVEIQFLIDTHASPPHQPTVRASPGHEQVAPLPHYPLAVRCHPRARRRTVEFAPRGLSDHCCLRWRATARCSCRRQCGPCRRCVCAQATIAVA